ncbi:8667_t:CDS:2 [Entrophospora sp. SA101]|nr:13927_t:CDS:2 [Entrophospora sp. SA101]CAJ0754173.1 4274_t:CDS:2 [Entrophospora sp. SA101]CAJ0755073.1 14725_t:CDS:2 [Entrophospora sp. SA101]CAJ0757501.1 8954_t:CDS:2 [Entrophospora sp. SA101]CAJ0761062.1 8667_t:CDS:2 [Entrophospora sp. SA101]
MLVSDMGGHGRALEALDEALNDKDLEKVSFLTIMEGVYAKLSDFYNEWISQTSYLKPILRIILTQVIVEANKVIPGTNLKPEDFSKLDWGRLTCPYIWLWLLSNASEDPTLQSWNFKYYQEVQHNEDLSVFDPNQHVDLKELHSGAWHNFGDIKIINKALILEKATVWTSTKSSSGTRTVQCEKVNVQLAEASHCIINKLKVPYGNCFCPIYIANLQNFSVESYQCKFIKASAAINEQLFMEEYNKAAEPETDVFILFTTGKCDITSLPPRSAIVKSVYTVLTAITGIGTKRADVIMDE